MDDELAPYVRLTQVIRVGWEEEVLVLPVGRCLLIASENETEVFVELEQEGAGYLRFDPDDPRIARATWLDVQQEPESDGMEYRDDTPNVYKRRNLAEAGSGGPQAHQ